jgi:hypothetical protein
MNFWGISLGVYCVWGIWDKQKHVVTFAVRVESLNLPQVLNFYLELTANLLELTSLVHPSIFTSNEWGSSSFHLEWKQVVVDFLFVLACFKQSHPWGPKILQTRIYNISKNLAWPQFHRIHLRLNIVSLPRTHHGFVEDFINSTKLTSISESFFKTHHIHHNSIPNLPNFNLRQAPSNSIKLITNLLI